MFGTGEVALPEHVLYHGFPRVLPVLRSEPKVGQEVREESQILQDRHVHHTVRLFGGLLCDSHPLSGGQLHEHSTRLLSSDRLPDGADQFVRLHLDDLQFPTHPADGGTYHGVLDSESHQCLKQANKEVQ